ncbi:MAG: tRNA 2-thiouridine(34) synthase MnmA [Candidatus Staskawiczbacteria bacterium]|jgi:tRNA-specific 2-thiouridylase
MSKNTNKKIIVAMSGGVDSSVAAALLKKQGYFVVGVFMKFWKDGSDGKNRCCSIESEKLARLVTKKIGIPFYIVNIEKKFKKKVVDYFLQEYKKGNTPNPCVVCNKEIKFGFLIKKALSLGADFIATGHYAQIKNGRLLKGADKDKDQSYFLWQLNQKQLSRVLFPVGGYTKTEVRKLAKKFKLPTAGIPESQEVCFIQNSTNEFLKKYLKTKPGKILNSTGKIVGEHSGLWFYTIGQRKGLKINQGPWFVVDKNFKKNILIVSKNKNDLLKKELVVKDVCWISGKEPKLPMKVKCKIRYKSELADALIRSNKGGGVKIIFQKPQRAITPGQSAVFYKGNELLGGGVIE